MSISRRNFLKLGALASAAFFLPSCSVQNEKPNIILCMADDQGWGDVAYNGHPVLKTPYLDQMAAEGIRFDRFYSAGPVCSPTRGSVVTGRHPYRYGVFSANVGYLPPEEITLAEMLKEQGYKTGHFGKWHLGTLSRTASDGNRGGEEGETAYSPPWEHGFESCFSTESRVPTWNPMQRRNGEPFGTNYWSGEGQIVTDNLEGDDSRIIMDRVIPFIEAAKSENRPFFALIWFHSPHLPILAGPDYRALYEGHAAAEYYGVITALDEQMGRLRSELVRLGEADNTLLWYCSDNGPEFTQNSDNFGSSGGLRGHKRLLYEGGLRVPGLMLWPRKVSRPFVSNIPSVTSDFLPTIMDILGLKLPERPYDGISLLPLIEGRMSERPEPIAFAFNRQIALTDNQYKFYQNRPDAPGELYDLLADPFETNNLAEAMPELLSSMLAQHAEASASWQRSLEGADYV